MVGRVPPTTMTRAKESIDTWIIVVVPIVVLLSLTIFSLYLFKHTALLFHIDVTKISWWRSRWNGSSV